MIPSLYFKLPLALLPLKSKHMHNGNKLCQNLASLTRATSVAVLHHPHQGQIQRGFAGFERTPLFARFIRLTVPLLLPSNYPVRVTQSANLFPAFHFNAHAVKQFF